MGTRRVIRRGGHWAAVAGLVATSALMPGAAGATGATGLDWRFDASPWAKGAGTLTAATVVDGTSPAELWVVGTVSDPSTGRTRGLVARGPGDFQLLPAGDTDPDLNVELTDVDSAGDDVWAVGQSRSQTGTTRARIVRYDRRDPYSGGQLHPGPNRGSGLRSIDMLSPHDGWAVGVVESGSGAGSAETLILHWAGTAWTQVPSPNPGPDGNELTAVTARAADDVWAVGHTSGPDPARTLILHWDGTAWAQIPSPDPITGANKLLGVTVAGNDVWAVGYGNTDLKDLDESQRHAVAMRWDGQTWLVLSSLSARVTQFNDVTATSSADVWIAGYAIAQEGECVHVEHWDGSALRTSGVEFPYYGGHVASALTAIVGGTSAGPLWAVGWQLTEAVPIQQPAILRNDR